MASASAPACPAPIPSETISVRASISPAGGRAGCHRAGPEPAH
jgi:hypothetical protein